MFCIKKREQNATFYIQTHKSKYWVAVQLKKKNTFLAHILTELEQFEDKESFVMKIFDKPGPKIKF